MYVRGDYDPAWSVAGRDWPWASRRTEAGVRATFRSTEAGVPVFEKRYHFLTGGGLDVEYRWNAAAMGRTTIFAPEVSYAGPMEITASPGAPIWEYDIVTVAKSEKALEQTVQGRVGDASLAQSPWAAPGSRSAPPGTQNDATKHPSELAGAIPPAGLAAYVVVLLIATLTPFRADPELAAGSRSVIARAFHPSVAGRDVVDGARNIVLFAGWGVVWALTAAGGVRRIVLRATAGGAAHQRAGRDRFSSSPPIGTTSLLDLATNTGGAFGGAVMLIALVALGKRAPGALVHSSASPPCCLPGATGHGSLEAVIPLFRSRMEPSAHGGPFGPLRRQRLRHSSFGSLFEFTLSDLLHLPAGRSASRSPPWPSTAWPIRWRVGGGCGSGASALALIDRTAPWLPGTADAAGRDAEPRAGRSCWGRGSRPATCLA